MNNIYKVIWSKAKNCYVVASEIARSHTKSASGSEKIGGGTRRKLLASLMALSLLCGGLGVAEASVHVVESGETYEVLTTQEVKDGYGTKADVEANKNNIAALQTKTTEQGEQIAVNKTNIAKNTDNITKLENNKLDKTLASETYATKDALRDLKDTVNGKVDAATVTTALGDKANTDLSNLTADGETKIKNTMLADMALKADKTYVDTEVGKVDTKLADYAKTTDVYDKATVDGKIAANANATTQLSGKVTTAESDINTLKSDMSTAKSDIGTLKSDMSAAKSDINSLKAKDTELSGQIGANKTAIDKNKDDITQNKNDITNIKGKLTTAEGNIADNKKAIDDLKTKVGTVNNGTYLDSSESVGENLNKLNNGLVQEVTDRTAADNALSGRINVNANAIAHVNQELVNTNNHFNTELRKTNAALQAEGQVRAKADADLAKDIAATNKRTAGIGRTDTGVEADNQTVIEGTVHFDQKGNVSGVKDLKTDTIHATGKITSEGLDAGSGEITTKGKVSAGDVSTGTLETTGAATIGGDLTVNGKLNVDEISMKNDELDPNGDQHHSATTITADGISNNAKVTDKNGVTTESKFTHDKEGSTTYAHKGDAADWKESTSNVTADGVENVAKDSKDNNNTFTQTSTDTKNILKDKDGNTSTTRQDSKGIYGYAKDKDGNKSYTKQEGNRIAESVIGQDGKQTKSEMTSTDITNTAKDGTIKNDAKDIVNNATGDMTNIVGGKLTTTVGGNEIHEVKGTKTETVEGKVTENFKNGQATNVTGNQDIHVTGKQTNTVEGGQENIISGGQTNTITGGQINNITGDQTTTITGNKTETVTENVTEDYKKDLTTTVGGNETHEVKGTKTETVEGKVTENFKNGQETNVTGDQVIKVSGTQTTTATDINRNASSGMIDTIDNDYGTNTETKVAGKTTTDVSIKGTGEEGKYIRGANESRDYLIKGTLKNSETKTVEKTSTEITDGNGNTSSTIQDVKNLAGSVTNGTEIGVSGIHANNDGSVSIDSTVVGGSSISTINQKKDSITSQVTDGTTITKTEQGTKDITNTATAGTITNDAKNIVNKASENITNTAKNITNEATETLTDKVGTNTRVTTSTSITDTVGTANRKIENGKIIDTAGDSTVTTENGKGTTFAKTGSAAYSTDAGAPTDTKIAGNHITTGRVDANELGVSDKDGAKTADLSVKAGEGVKASASDGNTTGSLDVTAKEVGSSVTDASGKGSTFKQRIDAIMMESKNVSIKAEETLTNEAKVITNKASEVINNEAININNTAKGIITSKASEIKNQADKLISNKVGENTWENMEDGKITTSIKDGTKQNLTQSDAAGTMQSTVDGAKSTVTIQNADGLQAAVTNGTSTNASATTATSSAQTILSGGKANSVITTIDGTQFVNSEAATPVGEGTAVNTTIKGNTITTGKVTMDYADVMKDLGVRGNANITGKTTTGSLEVKGESKLTGNVTMESNATVKKDLTVEGTTTTKTLNVTENATVGGTLDVMQKATFHDAVDIAKDLSVGGNATIKGDVTAKSYKVGGNTYIDANGINANNQKITNVADGSISEGSKDAVNGGQLYGMKTDLEHKVDKVGANAAAMANLHPMEFDPDSKWNIAAAMGNYGSETATAIGAFYRPNEDVMVNFSTAFGTGENMVGGGVSVRLGKGSNKLSREESNALKDQVDDLTARMDALLSVLNPNMSKDFPDVPENHWAYEAVSRLAGNDIVQGYPDGEFHGERTMTRYEMAEIIYNALSRGAEAERKLVEEFKPELQAMAASEKATAERAEG